MHEGLIRLNCFHTIITNLNYSPESIIELCSNFNPKLTNLSNLPSSIEKFAFNNNISILSLPKNLECIYDNTEYVIMNGLKPKHYKTSNKNFKIIQKK